MTTVFTHGGLRNQFGLLERVEHDVVRLDVAMADGGLAGVQIIQGIGDLHEINNKMGCKTKFVTGV